MPAGRTLLIFTPSQTSLPAICQPSTVCPRAYNSLQFIKIKIKFILHQDEKNMTHLLLAYKWRFFMSLLPQNYLHFQ